MAKSTVWRMGISVSGFAAGLSLAIGGVVSDASTSDRLPRSFVTPVRNHLPEPDIESISVCDAERVAYALAVSEMDVALAAASQAYEAWYNCEYGTRTPGGVVSEIDLRGTFSVLEEEK